MEMALPVLPLARLRLRFDLEKGPGLSDFTGGAWRGGLGHALRARSCRTGAAVCTGCQYLQDCDYSLAFETPTPPDAPKLATTETAPHPFGLVALNGASGGQELFLTVYGTGIRFLAPLMQSLERAGQTGIGPQRSCFRLAGVECELPAGSGKWAGLGAAGNPVPSAAIPSAQRACTIRLITPLRLRRREVYLGPREFGFGDLTANLVRRISLLCGIYGETLVADFADLARRAAEVKLSEAHLGWRDWRRHSSRQGRRIAVGGLVGEFSVAALPAALWPYLWLGQFVQAGKGTAMGLGFYTITPAATTSL